MQAQAENTLDPSQLATRKVDGLSDLVAEMVLDACEQDESAAAAAADAAALAAARSVAIGSPPAPRVDSQHIDMQRVLAQLEPSAAPRAAARHAVVATFAALVVVGSAVAAFIMLR